jgi:hypothetical protein
MPPPDLRHLFVAAGFALLGLVVAAAALALR